MSALPEIGVMGRRWDTTRPAFFGVPEGLSLEHVILSSLERVYRERVYSEAQYRSLLRYARVRVDGVEIPRKEWGRTYPQAGARVEIFHGVRGGGGGGGKNPIAAILSAVVVVVATIATWYIGGVGGWAGAAALGGWSAAATGAAYVGIGVASTAALMAINALFPAPTPKAAKAQGSGLDFKSSPTYSINGGRNQANVGGYVPLILGRHRFCPPLGARSWTYWEGGKRQYFNMLVIWGHPDITVSDFRIGNTPVGYFHNVDHRFHQSTTGNDLAFFGKSVYEDSVGTLLADQSWHTRSIGEANDISLDFAFLKGMVFWPQFTGEMAIVYQGVPFPVIVKVNVQYKRSDEPASKWRALGPGEWTFSDATTAARYFTVRVNGLPTAEYDVRVRRGQPPYNVSYIQEECTWTVVRAIKNVAPFSTPVPVCCSELRIQANEQLAQYVDDFNAVCHSRLPDWNEATQSWVPRNTSNPASIMRYLLTSVHALPPHKVYSTDKLDNAKLVELWKYCNENGYEFNYVCDSEQATWARLIEVLAPGRAAPTTDVDGLWGVVIDRNGKKPVQMFTPRNSWGLSIQRGFAKLPDALRVTFVDEADDYVEKSGYVYNDGYSANGANGTQRAQDIIEWDFPGITKWENIWKQARLYLARTLHRQMTVTINTDWEWLACHRGDLVGVASDILANTFGTARIMQLVYRVEDEDILVGREEDKPLDAEGQPLVPVGVQLDDSVVFSEPHPARYGIAVRSASGALSTHELTPDYGEERQTLYFRNALNRANVPPLGALCSVSILGDEYAEYLVAGIEPGDNCSAKLTLIPYKMDEIEAATSGAIPPWQESTYMNVLADRSLPTPIIVLIRSDESVLGGYAGASIPRIAVWYERPTGADDGSSHLYQLMVEDMLTGEVFYSTATNRNEYIYVEGVVERREYEVRLRVLNTRNGRTSSWSVPIRHVVIGRTTPPPPPDAVYCENTVLKITQTNRPQDVVGHVVSMVFDEGDPFSYAVRLTTPHTATCEFDLAPWAGYARRAFVQTVDEIGLLSSPVSIAINLGDIWTDNVLFAISEREREWPGRIVNGRLHRNRLCADDATGLWPSDGALWQDAGNYPLWPSGSALRMSYTYRVTVPLAYSGAHVIVRPTTDSGTLLSIEYRVVSPGELWPTDDGADLWQRLGEASLWPEQVMSDWLAFPSTYVSTGAETLEFRVTWAEGRQAVVADIETIIDVPDREWAVEDLEISEAGTHVPLPQQYFRAVTNVVATLQYRDGDTGMTTARIPGSEIRGSDGFLTEGPVMLVLDANRNRTGGSADIRIKGY